MELQQPPYAESWHRSVNPQYAVLVGICTHLGCIPEFFPQPNGSQPAANWMGKIWPLERFAMTAMQRQVLVRSAGGLRQAGAGARLSLRI